MLLYIFLTDKYSNDHKTD